LIGIRWLAGLLVAGVLACWLAGVLACWLAGLLAGWLFKGKRPRLKPTI